MYDWINEEDCLEAVRQYGLALEFAKKQTEELCLEAIKNGLDNRNLIKIQWTPEMEKEWRLRYV